VTRVGYFIGAHHRFTGSQRSLWLLVRNLRAVEPVVFVGGEGVCAERFGDIARVVVVPLPAAIAGFGGGLVRAGLARRAFLGATALAPYTLRLMREFRRESVDLLHANDSRGLLLAGPAARLLGLPAIWHVRGNVTPLGPTYLRACHLVASHIIAVADAVRPPGEVTTIYNGVPIPPPSTPPSASPMAVVAVGSLVPWKGAHHLIEAARRLGPRVHVTFVGDRPDPSYRLDGAPNVTFAGWSDDPTSYMRAADVVCLPTIDREIFAGREIRSTEGLSRTVLEAMAHGRAVVASRVVGTPEQIVDGESGLLVPPSDPAALAAALARLADDPALRARLGAAARERAAARFSIEAMVTQTEAIYRRLSHSSSNSKAHKIRR
jgi:glycosyltransferase involved in cell wall biosynthesis